VTIGKTVEEAKIVNEVVRTVLSYELKHCIHGARNHVIKCLDQHDQLSPRLRCQMGTPSISPFGHSTSFKLWLRSLLPHGPRVTLAADF
jgi:hypothetical protein